jgi:hypothetical protein
VTSSGISVEPIFQRSFTGRSGLGSVASFAQVVVARMWAGIVVATDIQKLSLLVRRASVHASAPATLAGRHGSRACAVAASALVAFAFPMLYATLLAYKSRIRAKRQCLLVCLPLGVFESRVSRGCPE